MHIVVCIKQVPDSTHIRVHPVTNTIMRQGVPAIINPYDLFAIEEALRLKDRHGGHVTVISMGPPQAEPALQAIPEVILKVFPYVVTLLALIMFSKSTQAPRAAGEPFEKGKR